MELVFEFSVPKQWVRGLNLVWAGGNQLELSNDIGFVEIGEVTIFGFPKNKVPCKSRNFPSCTRIDDNWKKRKWPSKQKTRLAQKQERKKSYAEKRNFRCLSDRLISRCSLLIYKNTKRSISAYSVCVDFFDSLLFSLFLSGLSFFGFFFYERSYFTRVFLFFWTLFSM